MFLYENTKTSQWNHLSAFKYNSSRLHQCSLKKESVSHTHEQHLPPVLNVVLEFDYVPNMVRTPNIFGSTGDSEHRAERVND